MNIPRARATAVLLACSLGDAEGGPDVAADAVRQLLQNNGLHVGGPVLDGARHPSLPVTLLVEGGQAVVNMPPLNAQCAVPPEWLTAVRQRGDAYLIFATRPRPEATPGTPVTPESLAASAGDEGVLGGGSALPPSRAQPAYDARDTAVMSSARYTAPPVPSRFPRKSADGPRTVGGSRAFAVLLGAVCRI